MKPGTNYLIKYTSLLFLFSITSIFSQDTVRYTINQLDSIEYSRSIKKYPKFKLYISSGGLFSDIDGSIIANNKLIGVGTKLDFEDNLKLEKYLITYRLGAIYNLTDKSTLSAYFLVLNRNSSVTLNDSINFGEYKFNANAKFNFELDFSYLGLNYSYNIVSKPQYTTGVSAGLRLIRFKTSGSGSTIVNNQIEQRSVEKTLIEPGFLIGLNHSVYLLPNLLNRTSLEYFSITLGTLKASLFEARIGLEYYFHKNIGIGFMALANVLKIVSNSEESFNGEVSYNFKGVSLYFTARF